MARKRTKVAMSQAEATQLKTLVRSATDPRDKERLLVVLWATGGQHTLEDLARLAGRARFTIQVWLDAFTAGGPAQLLERAAPPGKASPVGQAKVQAQLQSGLRAGRWRTAGQVAARAGFRVPATSNRTRRPRPRFAPGWSKTSNSLTCPRIAP